MGLLPTASEAGCNKQKRRGPEPCSASHRLPAVFCQVPAPSTSSLGKGSIVLWFLTGKTLVICWRFPLHLTEEKCFILAAESLNTSSLSENYNSQQTLILPFAMTTHSLLLWSRWKERGLPSVQNPYGLEVQDCASPFSSKMDPTSHVRTRTGRVGVRRRQPHTVDSGPGGPIRMLRLRTENDLLGSEHLLI